MTEFLVLGLTVAIALVLAKSRLNYVALPELSASSASSPSDVTVIIPARNEAHQIERCIRSFPQLPVIVVDDGSSDATAAIARRNGARVIPAPPLSANAKGKPNACAAGADEAATKWLLFVDADTWFEANFAASIVAYAETQNLEMVSAFLFQRCVTLAEHALLPYAFALYFTGVSARNVNSASSRECLANGQCILFEKSAYDDMGGHESVIDSVIEDVALARRAKRFGVRIQMIRAEKLGSVRMYDSFAAIWRGFQKNSFRFLTANPAEGVQIVLASIFLTSWLPVLLLGIRDFPEGVGLSPTLLLNPVAWLFLAPFAQLYPWYRGKTWKESWRILLAPIGIYLFQLIALNGMLATIARRRTSWKGRHV
jgi:glycosyltransferase involved in cell wall biosynthesis